MPEIVRDEINPTSPSNRTVRIDSIYSFDGDIAELYAYFKNNHVKLTSMSNDKKPRSFSISADKMDTLAAQWMLFRENCISAKEAEEKRVEEVKAEAFKLIEEEAPYIKVSEEENTYYNTTYWKVDVEEINFSASPGTPDGLLEAVNTAMELYIQYTLNINETKEIVKAHREIRVTYAKSGTKHWRVSIPDREGPYAEPCVLYNAADLLTSVKEALAWLEQQQAEQAANAAQSEQKTWWQDAMDIAQECPAIHIQDRRDFGQSGWNVTADDVQFGKTAHSSEELFHLVQEAHALVNHQPTCAQNAAQSDQGSTVATNQ